MSESGKSGLRRRRSGLFRASIGAFAVKLFAAAVIFGYNVVVARLLGVHDAGLYFLAHSLLMIAAVIGRAGLDNPLVRFVASGADSGDWRQVRGVAKLGLFMGTATAAATSAIGWWTGPVIADRLFGEPALGPTIQVLSLSVVPLCLTLLYSQLLRGLSLITLHLITVSALVPALASIAAFILAPRFGLIGVAVGWLMATVLALAVAAFAWHRRLVGAPAARGEFSWRQLSGSAHPLFWVSLSSVVVRWSSPLMLGIWSTSANVALFTAATRTAFLTTLILVAVTSIVAPQFAAAHARGDTKRLEHLARSSSTIMTLAATPVCIILVFAPKLVLAAFGDGFDAASTALVLLAVAQFVNVATGSVQYLLAMSGREIALRNLTLVAALSILVLNAVLIPRWGLTGAALAMMITVVGQNLATTWVVHRTLGIWPLPTPWRTSPGNRASE